MAPGRSLQLIAFDADDTLWHNERFFKLTQDRFAELLVDYADPSHLNDRLVEAERRNLGHYGYGIKGFVLSMIETALDVTGNQVPGRVVRELIDAGQEMLRHPIELLPHVERTITALAPDFTLLLITKGDLLDQERKLAQSGLGDHFDGVEIVSEKNSDTYRRIFEGAVTKPNAALMAGNSLRSDVIPAIEAGAWGVHVPHELTWAIEHAEAPDTHPRFRQLPTLGHLVDLVQEIG